MDEAIGSKTCRECGECLPKSAFPTKQQLGRTYLYSYCRPCKVVRFRRWRQDNPDKVKIQEATYRSAHRDELRARDRGIYAREYAEDRTPFVERAREWRRNNPERAKAIFRAANIVRRAVESGRIAKPDTCVACGQSGVAIEAAHSDYSRPLDIRWLCRPCHRQWDAAVPKSAGVVR